MYEFTLPLTINDKARLPGKQNYTHSYLGATIRRKSTFYGLAAEYKVRDDLSDQNVSIVLKHDKGAPTQINKTKIFRSSYSKQEKKL